MTDKFDEMLNKIGEVAGVGGDWYEIGEAEESKDGETRYAVYAKTEEIAEKVQSVFDKFFDNSMREGGEG